MFYKEHWNYTDQLIKHMLNDKQIQEVKEVIQLLNDVVVYNIVSSEQDVESLKAAKEKFDNVIKDIIFV